MSFPARPFGWIASILACLGVAGLSRVAYDPVAKDDAVLRLAWRAPGERVEECRTPTAEELEGVPIHMRRTEICEGRLLPYHLRVFVADDLVLEETIHPAGARADRPLYVVRELRRPVGKQKIRVEWRLVRPEAGPAVPELAGADALVPVKEGVPREAGAPSSHDLQLDTTVRAGPRDVVLITMAEGGRALVVRAAERDRTD